MNSPVLRHEQLATEIDENEANLHLRPFSLADCYFRGQSRLRCHVHKTIPLLQPPKTTKECHNRTHCDCGRGFSGKGREPSRRTELRTASSTKRSAMKNVLLSIQFSNLHSPFWKDEEES